MTKRDWLDLADAWNRTAIDLSSLLKTDMVGTALYAALISQTRLAQLMAKHLVDIAERRSDED